MVRSLGVMTLLAAVLCVTACTDWGAGPDIAGGTERGVTVRYDADQVDAKAVETKAASYCRGLGKQAKLRSRFASEPKMTYADYDCVSD